MVDDVRSFRIEVPDDVLRDLRERLERTRWPERETAGDWSQGVPLASCRRLPADHHPRDPRGDRLWVTDLAGSVHVAALDGSNRRYVLLAQGNLTGIAYAQLRHSEARRQLTALSG